MGDYSVNKSTVERYEIRNKGIWTWANITISGDGDFNVISDYGNYNYAWRSFGDDFKKFLIDLGDRCKEYPTSYLYNKIHNRELSKRVDVEKTATNWKYDIFEMRRNKDIDEDKARNCFDAICRFESECHSECSVDYLYSFFDQMYDIDDVIDGEYISYNLIHSSDRDCEAFCGEIMPLFAAILRDELERK